MPQVTAYQCDTCGAPGGRFADPADALDHITANPGHAIATHSDDVIEVSWRVTTDYKAPVRIDAIRAELVILTAATGDTDRLEMFDSLIADLRAGGIADPYEVGTLRDALDDVAYIWAGLEDDVHRDGAQQCEVTDVALPGRPSAVAHTTTCGNCGGGPFVGPTCPSCLNPTT